MRRHLLTLLAAMPATGLTQQPRDFGMASLVPPAGWTIDSRPTVLSFASIRGPHRCIIAMGADEPAQATLEASFATVWNAAFGPNNYRRADRPHSTEQVSPAGYRHAAGEGELEDRAGNHVLARLYVFPVGDRIQSVVFLVSSRAALDACRDDWAAFFASLRFRAGGAEAGGAPVTRGAPNPPAPAARPNATTDRTPQRFDNITFVPPLGWSVRRVGGVVELAPTDTRPPEALQLLLLSGRVSSAPLEREVDASFGEVQSLLNAQPMLTVNRVPYDLEQPTRSLRGVEYVRGRGGMRRNDGVYSVDVYVFRVGQRVERAAVISRDFRDNTVMVTTSSNAAYGRAIRELLFTMAFANQPDRAVPPAGLRPGGIVGVWGGLSMSTGRITTSFAVFFDNGMAYFSPKFPVRGLLEIDPVVEQPADQRAWGAYTMTGDAGTLTMPYGVIPLRTLGAALELTTNRTAHRFVRLAMPGGPLDGTWCMSGGQCLRLTAQGRFDDAGAVRALEHSTYAFPSNPAGGQGRYALREHTLVLTYDSGQEVRVGFVGLLPNERAPSPSELWLGFEADRLMRR